MPSHGQLIVMITSGLTWLAKVLIAMIGVVLVIYIGTSIGVWMFESQRYSILHLLDFLPAVAAWLGKVLLLILLVGVVLGVLRVLWSWLDGNHPDPMRALLEALPNIQCILGKALLLTLLLVVGTAVVRIVGGWIFGSDSITISSFTDTRAEASAGNGGGLGHTLTDALTAEIHRINQLHTLRNPWGSADEVPPLEMTGPQVYERVGTIGVAGLELPVGEVAQALQSLFPSWYDRYVITGSVQRVLSGQTTKGRITARLEENGRTRKHWNHELPLHDAGELHRHLRQLAYEIMWNTLKGVEANSLGNFQDLLQAFRHFGRIKRRVTWRRLTLQKTI